MEIHLKAHVNFQMYMVKICERTLEEVTLQVKSDLLEEIAKEFIGETNVQRTSNAIILHEGSIVVMPDRKSVV